MELAGLKVVMDADFSQVYASFSQANTMLQNFANNAKTAFSSIPNVGSKINFTSTGASEAISASKQLQQQRRLEIAGTKELLAVQKEAERQTKAQKDEYGQLVAANQKLVREYYNAAAAVLKNGDAAGITAKRLEEMQQAALKGQQQLQQIEAGAGRFQRNVGNYSGAMTSLRISVQQISGEIPNFFNSMRVGLLSISNNIQPVMVALDQLKKQNAELVAQGKPTVNAFKAIASSFISWQTVILVGVGLLSKYGPALIDWANDLIRGKAAVDRNKESIEERNKVVEEATKSSKENAAQELASAAVLYAAATNVNLGYNQRLDAVNKLQQQYPGYFANLDKETIMAGGAAKAYNELAGAIVKRITLQVHEKELEVLIKQGNQLQENLEKSNKYTKNEQLGLRIVEDTAEKEADRVQISGDLIANQKEQQSVLAKIVADQTKLNKLLQTNSVGASSSSTSSPSKRSAQEFKELSDVSRQALPVVVGKVDAVGMSYGRLAESIRQANISQAFNEQEAAIELHLQRITEMMESAVEDSVGGIASSIGSIIAGVENPFASLISTIAGSLKQLGQYLIQIGITKEAIEKALKAIGLPTGGAGVIIAGAAAVALGTALQAAATNRVRGTRFADGGMVYGATQALVGEYSNARSNPEVIAPLDKLQAIMNNAMGGRSGQQLVVLETVVSGNDLLFVMDRAKKNRDR